MRSNYTVKKLANKKLKPMSFFREMIERKFTKDFFFEIFTNSGTKITFENLKQKCLDHFILSF